MQILITVLAYVVGVVGSTPVVSVVLPLVGTIGYVDYLIGTLLPLAHSFFTSTLLVSIISLVVQLVPGVLAGLVPTLTSLVPALGYLNFTSILSLIPGQ